MQVTSIHVYSLGPHPVKVRPGLVLRDAIPCKDLHSSQDMQLLADVSRPILDVADDDLVTLRPLRNPHVRRRERRSAGLKTAPAPDPVKPKPATVKAAPAAKVKEEPKIESKASSKESKPDSKPTSKESTPVPSGTKKAAPKRGAPGGIMQSFAKAAAMPKKTPKPPAPEEADIQGLALSDDGEDDDAAMPEPKSKAELEPDQETEGARKSRNARQEALKRMMEDSSEEEEEPEKEDTPMEEADEPSVPEEEKKEDAEPAEVVSSAGNGRRRGKRQVMKKKTVMDEQGYLGEYISIMDAVTISA